MSVSLSLSGSLHLLQPTGSAPGPTINNIVGRHSVVRFNNKLIKGQGLTTPGGGTQLGERVACTKAGRKGRPISVHFHGQGSLAPYDGWAEVRAKHANHWMWQSAPFPQHSTLYHVWEFT